MCGFNRFSKKHGAPKKKGGYVYGYEITDSRGRKRIITTTHKPKWWPKGKTHCR